MADLDVVVMGFCPQYRSNFHVTGSKGDPFRGARAPSFRAVVAPRGTVAYVVGVF